MADTQIRFDDGAAYERMMGNWSQRVGTIFLDWLAAPAGLKWVDVGCGNGSFTELIVDRCRPAEVQGIDPSEGQLAFARTRPAARLAKFGRGDAMAPPFSAGTFDVATMALVIFFVPDPAKGVAEMVRVVRPGGTVAAYAWDMLGGGFPLEPIRVEMRAMGFPPLSPPSVEASRAEILRGLWTEAGLDAIETREISVQRTFTDFDDLWTTSLLGSNIGPIIAAMPAADVELLKGRVRAQLSPDTAGRITCGARANAIKGRVPK
ncbi:MAG TPA: class I SAM-dependent methyltransferase [Pseudolabrys sp.]|nr:class I SAM-dependent methyltransferase [Pseudolabrys sp.]